MRTYSLAHQTEELKKLIAEHPDYSICVLAGEDIASDTYWTLCSEVNFKVGELLDTDYYDYDDHVFADREHLKNVVEERLEDDFEGEAFDKAVSDKLAELEPFWKNAIFIYADA